MTDMALAPVNWSSIATGYFAQEMGDDRLTIADHLTVIDYVWKLPPRRARSSKICS
jgi:hypothetical protein